MYIALWLPAVLAFFLAPRVGRNRFLWAAICFCTSLIGLVALILLPSRKHPKLADYLQAHPECQTTHGVTCAYCGSRSIRLWRETGFMIARQYHMCNSCGKTLYTS
ncbi:hypothetical protein ACUXQ2_005527 [Cupriavidus metallidurans]